MPANVDGDLQLGRCHDLLERSKRSILEPSPGVQNRLTEEEIVESCVAYKSGVTAAELARFHHVHRTTIARHLDAAGIQRRRPGGMMTEQDVPAAVARYQEGETLKEIAATYGVDKETVRKRLLDAGVVMRDTRFRRAR